MLITLRCSGCGTEIQKQHWTVNQTRNFCSLECKWNSERTAIVCQNCKISFTKKSKINNSARKFCSRKCYLEWKAIVGRVKLVCQQCGKNFTRQKWVPSKSYICCSRKCHTEFQRKDRVINGNGYVAIWVDDQKVLEHRFVMEQYLGRSLLENEIVHHINNNRTDNRVENLQVMTQGQHVGLHNKNRQL